MEVFKLNSTKTTESFPKKFQLFESSHIEFAGIQPIKIDDITDKEIKIIFPIFGEIQGYAGVFLEQRDYFELQKEEYDLIAETTNIIIGNFLTDIEDRMDISAIVKAPLLNRFGENQDSIKNSRIYMLLQNYSKYSEQISLRYKINLDDREIMFNILLILRESQIEGNA